MRVKEWIRKHPKLDYFQTCLRHINNQEYIDIVTSINRNPNLLYFFENGDKYPENNFYDIYLDFPSKGFFALLNQTLDALKFSERFNLSPIVTWSDKCLYKEEKLVNGESNPFHYYYDKINTFTRKDLENATRVLKYNSVHRALNKNTPFHVVSKTIIENNCYDKYIKESAKVYHKYINYKPEIFRYIQESKNRIGFNDCVLGVHVRATDFYKGYINHAVVIEKNEYINATKIAFETGEFQNIFLATDDKKVVEDFKKEFGERVLFCDDTYRSEDGSAIHFSEDNRQFHKYKLGLEVIRDMQLLADCKGLIGGHSNVCIMAQIVKLSTNNSYEYLKILDKGFNQSGITTYQANYK